jgi:NADH-quinone oxidoreductase subunit L
LPFAVGLALIFFKFGSLEFATIFAAVPQHGADTYALFGTTFSSIEVIAFLLFIGAMGKSAQLGFHVWLPDAMEGPTPVSALIHAATMVTAGVFLMARMSPVMEYAPYALGFVTFIGASTALFAATIGCAQNDIKRVIAYSTCSQLGYMFSAAGVGAYQASMFHLITHAFFKALLFLAAGSVIHAMSDEQDMRKMGGLWRRIPITCMVMWVGSLALAGIFPFAGFYSKDAIIDATFAAGTPIGYYAWVCTILAAVLTGFYSWRLLFLTFHGKPRASAQVMAHVHESPAVMLLPLVVLAIGALVAGFGLEDSFLQAAKAAFWRGSIFTLPGNQVLVQMEIVEHEIPWLPLAPTAAGVLGILVAFVMYVLNPLLPVRMAQVFGPIYRLFLNKWYFDEFYDRFFVQPLIRLSRILWQVGDATLIDGVPNGLAELTSDGSRQIVKIQTGSLAVYAFAMLIGVVVLVAIFMLSR